MRRAGEAREPEGQSPPTTGDHGESVGDPDVLLDVPVLNVEELELEVEDLRARVSFGAELGDMVKINVGIEAEVGTAKIELQGVEVQAQLKARLDNVRTIFSEVLTALQRDPELAQNMLRSAGPVDDVVGGRAHAAGGTSRPGPAHESPNEAQGAPDGTGDPGGLAELGIEEEYVDERGRLVGRARDESGRVVEGVLDEDGNALGGEAASPAEPVEATDAARRRAEELGLDLSVVKGTGSGGRILVRDVEKAV
ncbi:E3 binding domain-containing protein [Rubrobacter marinus]|uniref:E3 binding domain-containing protein n=1 Tax=Rubrobacter marinus TaxID=2653852 RepID=UPI001A9FA755|nr:E3 binding domain-containing protein [Rubrobacter marinus]